MCGRANQYTGKGGERKRLGKLRNRKGEIIRRQLTKVENV